MPELLSSEYKRIQGFSFQNSISLIASGILSVLILPFQDTLFSMTSYSALVFNCVISPMTNFIEMIDPANFDNFLAVKIFC